MTDIPLRKPPAPFIRVKVARFDQLTPYMTRVTLTGPELGNFAQPGPAASVRLLLPDGHLVLPYWAGNNFVLPSGVRPTMRTMTPRHFRPDAGELDIDVVLHGTGAASEWASNLVIGHEVAVSGPGRPYEIETDATAFLLVGDESGIPAICQLLEVLPEVPITVHLETVQTDARVDLHRDVSVAWHLKPVDAPSGTALVEAVMGEALPEGVRVWAAGEAAAMQRIRKHLAGVSLPRPQTHIRGYWKAGR